MAGQNNKFLALVFIAMILVSASGLVDAGECESKGCYCRNRGGGYTKTAVAATAGGFGLLGVATYTILGLGFGPLGIAAGSIASGLMSTAATTGVGGVVVGGLQAAGAAGMAAGTKAAIVGVGAVASGYAASDGCDCSC